MDEARKEYLREYRQNKQAGRNYRDKRRVVRDTVKVTYGCMNPGCQWVGPFTAEMLDYHHVQDKAFNIGANSGKPVEVIRQEINKCVVLCANCHRQETHGLLDVSQLMPCNVDENWKCHPH